MRTSIFEKKSKKTWTPSTRLWVKKMDRKWLAIGFFFHECTTQMLLVQNDSYGKIPMHIFTLKYSDMQIGTKMGQQKIGFLAHFLGTHANANFDKWVLCPSLGCGWLVWAGFSPAKSLRAKKSKQECKKSSFDALRPYWKFNHVHSTCVLKDNHSSIVTLYASL